MVILAGVRALAKQLPPNAADGSRRGGRSERDPVRSDFPGLGFVIDGRRSRVYRSVTDGSAGSLLPLSEGTLPSTDASAFAGKCR